MGYDKDLYEDDYIDGNNDGDDHLGRFDHCELSLSPLIFPLLGGRCGY